jgi:hypothetical protein
MRRSVYITNYIYFKCECHEDVTFLEARRTGKNPTLTTWLTAAGGDWSKEGRRRRRRLVVVSSFSLYIDYMVLRFSRVQVEVLLLV